MDMRVLHGDCLEVLKTLNENSVDAIVTDPPYGLKFMGKKWDYDIPNRSIWEALVRCLKPGGQLLSFGGTRTYHRLVCEIEDAGFEIRDQLQWLYGSGFPKSHNLPGGWGTALKPANEPIVLARKPLSEKTVAKNVEKWGTGALNIDESRIGISDAVNFKSKQNHNNMGYGGAKDTEAREHYNPKGRWPANLLLDEVAAEMLDEQSGPCRNTYNDSGGASRFFYVAKSSKRERNAGLEGMPQTKLQDFADGTKRKLIAQAESAKNPNLPRANHHPTVKPIKLMEYLCRLITPPNGIILDPFMGSGSTGVAAKRLGFQFIGIEMEKEYVQIAEKRIASA